MYTPKVVDWPRYILRLKFAKLCYAIYNFYWWYEGKLGMLRLYIIYNIICLYVIYIVLCFKTPHLECEDQICCCFCIFSFFILMEPVNDRKRRKSNVEALHYNLKALRYFTKHDFFFFLQHVIIHYCYYSIASLVHTQLSMSNLYARRTKAKQPHSAPSPRCIAVPYSHSSIHAEVEKTDYSSIWHY